MRFLIAYVIWNKHDMITWLCSGILKSFKPGEVDLYFLLDDPIDGTDMLFDDYVPTLLKGYSIKVDIFCEKKNYKFELQNIALEYGLSHGYDWVICPQDDQKIEDPFLLDNLTQFKSDIGLIGGRDGFASLDYKNATGSLFSVPTGDGYKWLKNGEWRQVRFLNDGPLIYHKSVIARIGYHDLGFKVFMSELDYCARCHAAGLSNINLGMSIVHEKFTTFRSNVYNKKFNYSELDTNYFRSKWAI